MKVTPIHGKRDFVFELTSNPKIDIDILRSQTKQSEQTKEKTELPLKINISLQNNNLEKEETDILNKDDNFKEIQISSPLGSPDSPEIINENTKEKSSFLNVLPSKKEDILMRSITPCFGKDQNSPPKQIPVIKPSTVEPINKFTPDPESIVFIHDTINSTMSIKHSQYMEEKKEIGSPKIDKIAEMPSPRPTISSESRKNRKIKILDKPRIANIKIKVKNIGIPLGSDVENTSNTEAAFFNDSLHKNELQQLKKSSLGLPSIHFSGKIDQLVKKSDSIHSPIGKFDTAMSNLSLFAKGDDSPLTIDIDEKSFALNRNRSVIEEASESMLDNNLSMYLHY